eukprot:CAMPEP_0119066644 /NCGR_PEP_ID=MMETSP1178-20130426/9143_1 /TAXON_ID=33656 /ORGANISM="unid sp, Strain CCMP2000" /LENGTH=152 /DNA_ID=CAMNT_0007048253 /DNA_START=176 /DNA_END=636 /DNA_ORIENTATION=+
MAPSPPKSADLKKQGMKRQHYRWVSVDVELAYEWAASVAVWLPRLLHPRPLWSPLPRPRLRRFAVVTFAASADTGPWARPTRALPLSGALQGSGALGGDNIGEVGIVEALGGKVRPRGRRRWHGREQMACRSDAGVLHLLNAKGNKQERGQC